MLFTESFLLDGTSIHVMKLVLWPVVESVPEGGAPREGGRVTQTLKGHARDSIFAAGAAPSAPRRDRTLYTGQRYTPPVVSCRCCCGNRWITGISLNSCFGSESSRECASAFQRAPSRYSPLMNTPSSGRSVMVWASAQRWGRGGVKARSVAELRSGAHLPALLQEAEGERHGVDRHVMASSVVLQRPREERLRQERGGCGTQSR